MNSKKYLILFVVPIVSVIAVVGFAYDYNFDTDSSITIEPQVPLAPPYVPRLAEFGQIISEDEIAKTASMAVVKFEDLPQVRGTPGIPTNIDLLQVRDDDGYIYYLYGPTNLAVNPNMTIKEFVDNGGIIVRTIVTTNPAVALKHIDKTVANYLEIDGMSAYSHEATADYPAYLEIYPGDERKVTIIADGSVEHIVEIAKKLGIEPGVLDLEKYPEIPYSPESPLVKP